MRSMQGSSRGGVRAGAHSFLSASARESLWRLGISEAQRLATSAVRITKTAVVKSKSKSKSQKGRTKKGKVRKDQGEGRVEWKYATRANLGPGLW
jgi:hypothetical protein